MPNITIIAACTPEGVIGKDNKLPWKIKSEMEYFLSRVAFKSLVMGKNTCMSLHRPINTGTNYVLTSDKVFQREGFTVIRSIEELFELEGENEVIVVGGASIYNQFLDLANTDSTYRCIVELSIILNDYEGDSYFPLEKLKGWQSKVIRRETNHDGKWMVTAYY